MRKGKGRGTIARHAEHQAPSTQHPAPSTQHRSCEDFGPRRWGRGGLWVHPTGTGGYPRDGEVEYLGKVPRA